MSRCAAENTCWKTSAISFQLSPIQATSKTVKPNRTELTTGRRSGQCTCLLALLLHCFCPEAARIAVAIATKSIIVLVVLLITYHCSRCTFSNPSSSSSSSSFVFSHRRRRHVWLVFCFRLSIPLAAILYLDEVTLIRKYRSTSPFTVDGKSCFSVADNWKPIQMEKLVFIQLCFILLVH